MSSSPNDFTRVIDHNKKLTEQNAKLREHNQQLQAELAKATKDNKKK